MFPPVRFSLEVVSECRSSQELLLAARGQPGFHGKAVLALKQTAGYGRRGREWNTGHGNLALSLGIEIPRSEQAITLLPFVAGIAQFRVVSRLLPPPSGLRLKWPNDLYLHGKKLSGLIAQARQYEQGSEVVLGIGVNLKEAPLPGQSIALAELGVAVEPGEFARALLAELEDSFLAAKDFGWIKEEWERGAELSRHPMFVVGEPEAVRPLELLPTGELRVKSYDGTERTLASEETSVRYQPSSAPSP